MLLPEPLGPTMPKNSPCSTSNETSVELRSARRTFGAGGARSTPSSERAARAGSETSSKAQRPRSQGRSCKLREARRLAAVEHEGGAEQDDDDRQRDDVVTVVADQLNRVRVAAEDDAPYVLEDLDERVEHDHRDGSMSEGS